MLETVLERYRDRITPEIQEKLTLSRKAAEEKHNEKRDLYCPVCGFYLESVYGHEHIITAKKCPKCKFNEPMDLALFRTSKRHYGRSYGPKKNRYTR